MINCDGLVKIYETDDKKVMALEGLDLTVETGEMLAVIGKSGSGKSTLLNMIGGLETPTAGVLTIDGKDISTYSEAEMVRYRRNKVGFVWQKSAKNLFPYLTVLQNVEAVMMFENSGNTDNLKHREIIKKRKDNNKSYALKLLNAVGLQEHKDKLPAQLSGGEQQRAAIAVALANKPDILLADEPTGSVQLVQHYPKTTPVIFWSLSILISLMTERQRVRFSSRVKVSYIFLKSFCNSFSTAAKSGGASCVVSGIWFNAAVYIS